MKISIITCTYNRKESLNEMYSHFNEVNTFPIEDFEIIIINDGEINVDDLVDNYADLPIKVYKNRGKGLAAGRNTGSYLAQNDLLLYLDDDILINENHLQLHIEAHKSNPNSLVTANRFDSKKMIEEGQKTSFGRYKLERDYVWYEIDGEKIDLSKDFIEMAGLAGFSCSLTREDFLKIGDFNERFPFAGNEDLDFYWRAKKMGYKLIFDTKNYCYHNELFNLNKEKWMWRQTTGIKSLVHFCELNPERKETYYYKYNLKFNRKDSTKERVEKIKRLILRQKPILHFLLFFIKMCEKIKLPDKFIFKLYNLEFISRTNRAFREEFSKLKL
jgi:GT2 family glycosyltransferase